LTWELAQVPLFAGMPSAEHWQAILVCGRATLGDVVIALENAVYSVISPEGCASILWRTADKAADAAEAMKVTAADLKQLGVIERIVPEPMGGAHRAPGAMIATLGEAIGEELDALTPLSREAVRVERRTKFLALA